jgi:hypothetical protein
VIARAIPERRLSGAFRNVERYRRRGTSELIGELGVGHGAPLLGFETTALRTEGSTGKHRAARSPTYGGCRSVGSVVSQTSRTRTAHEHAHEHAHAHEGLLVG